MTRIVLSAGHDPKSRGACFPDPKVTPGAVPVFVEFDEACAWVAVIAQVLRDRGADVLLVPDHSFEELGRTIDWINALSPRADMAVEIHFNDAVSAGKQVGRGCETLIAPNSPKGLALGHAIQTVLARHLSPDRGVHIGWLRRDRPGVVDYPGDHHGDERVAGYLRNTNCPAVIVEPGFVNDYKRITAQRVVACEAIAEAMLAVAARWRLSEAAAGGA